MGEGVKQQGIVYALNAVETATILEPVISLLSVNSRETHA